MEKQSSQNTVSAFESVDDMEKLRDYVTPSRVAKGLELKDNAASQFESLPAIQRAQGSGEGTPQLDTLARVAVLQEVIDSGKVQGVIPGTPVQEWLRPDGYRETASSVNKVLTPSSTPEVPIPEDSNVSRRSAVRANLADTRSHAQDSSKPSETSASVGEETSDDTKKSRQIMIWDPEDWNVRRKESYSQYYGIYLSNDFVDLWGVHRCPALEKRNHPFTKFQPFLLYPGKILYLQSVNEVQENRYFIAVECHFHDRKAKKAMQVLVFIPPEFRPELPEDSNEVEVLGSTFLVLNVNQIDWIRSDNLHPPAVTWGEFGLMRNVLEELSQLPQLPSVCLKGSDIMPAETKENRKKNKRRSVPLLPQIMETSSVPPTRARKERLKKQRTESSVDSASYSNAESGASEPDNPDDDFEDEQLIEIKPPKAHSAKTKPPRKKSKKSGGSKDFPESRKEMKETALSFPNASFNPAMSAIPTPANLWAPVPQVLPGGGVSSLGGLSEADRSWLTSEIKNVVSDAVHFSMKDIEASVTSALRKFAENLRTQLDTKFRDMGSKLDTLGGTLSKVQSKVEEIGGTPSFTWDQIVAQCRQFQEIQMFSKGQEVPPSTAQFHHPSAGGTSGGYYMSHPGAMPGMMYGAYPVKSEVSGRSYPMPPPSASVASSAATDIGSFGGAAKLTDMSNVMQQQFPQFRIKSPGGNLPFFAGPPIPNASLVTQQAGSGVSSSPMLPRKSLVEDLSGAIIPENPNPQMMALQQLLPGLSREELENLMRRNI